MSRLLVVVLVVVAIFVLFAKPNKPKAQSNEYIATVATVAAYESLPAQEPEPVQATVSEPEQDSDPVLDLQAQVVWDELNASRVKANLPPFIFSQELTEECKTHVAKKSGSRFRSRSLRGGNFGECTAISPKQSPVKQWLSSRLQRRIILTSGQAEAGIAHDGDYYFLKTTQKRK